MENRGKKKKREKESLPLPNIIFIYSVQNHFISGQHLKVNWKWNPSEINQVLTMLSVNVRLKLELIRDEVPNEGVSQQTLGTHIGEKVSARLCSHRNRTTVMWFINSFTSWSWPLVALVVKESWECKKKSTPHKHNFTASLCSVFLDRLSTWLQVNALRFSVF